MLREAGVGPFPVFHGFFVFFRAGVDGATSFSYIDGFLTAAALELVDSFTFTRRRASLIFCAEDVLELLAAFVVEVAACFGEGAFELMRDAGDEAESCIWAEAYVLIDGLRVEGERGEEVLAARFLGVLRLLL